MILLIFFPHHQSLLNHLTGVSAFCPNVGLLAWRRVPDGLWNFQNSAARLLAWNKTLQAHQPDPHPPPLAFCQRPESQPNPPAHLQKLQLKAIFMIVTIKKNGRVVLVVFQHLSNTVQRNASLVSLHFSTPFFPPHKGADTLPPTALKSLHV